MYVLIIGLLLFVTITISQPAEIFFGLPIALISLIVAVDYEKNSNLDPNKFACRLRYFSVLIFSTILLCSHVFLNSAGALLATKNKLINNLGFQYKKNNYVEYEIVAGEMTFRKELSKYMQYEKLLTVGHNNMYSWMWSILPASGDLLYWHNGVTFNGSKNYFKTYSTKLDDANVIGLSYTQHGDSTQHFKTLFADYLKDNFILTYSSDNFEVYLRH